MCIAALNYARIAGTYTYRGALEERKVRVFAKTFYAFLYVCECINKDIPYIILYYKYIYIIYTGIIGHTKVPKQVYIRCQDPSKVKTTRNIWSHKNSQPQGHRP